jgi:hypothetical protein
MVVSTFNDWQIGAVVENAAIGDIVSGRPSFLVDLRQPLYPKKIDIRKSLSLTSASALLRFALEAGAVDACLCMLGGHIKHANLACTRLLVELVNASKIAALTASPHLATNLMGSPDKINVERQGTVASDCQFSKSGNRSTDKS